LKGSQISFKFSHVIVNWDLTARQQELELQLALMCQAARLPQGQFFSLKEQNCNFLHQLVRRHAGYVEDFIGYDYTHVLFLIRGAGVNDWPGSSGSIVSQSLA
jgi:hypothetical protein